MKKIYILTLFATLNFSFAQDPQILNNTWYLKYITLDGVTHYPPNPNITLNFNSSNSFITDPCNYLAGSVLFENNYTNFSTSESVMSLIICPDETLGTFEGIYFPFFTDNFSTNPVNFTYSIIDLSGQLTLFINSAFNEQAVYGNDPLSTQQLNKESFSFYPNPSADCIQFKLNTSPSINATLEIYNEIGILHKTEKLTATTTQIDIKNLASGIYFLKITTQNGTTVKKLIKK
jgi:hypothetical protein